ncbi:MAG: 50S ribosomal protein L29 [Pseudomonadota bacterium]
MTLEEMRSKTRDELLEELVSLRREQFNLRMQRATQQLSQNHQFRQVRRDIARINTILSEQSKVEKDA